MNLSKKLFVFNNEEQGVTAISFAILLPVLILLLIGVVQLGIVMVIQNALEAGARQASRYGVVQNPSASTGRSAAITAKIRNVVSTYSGGIVDTSKLVITTTAYPNLMNTTSGTSGSVGTSGQAVQYKISYTYDTLYPIFSTSTTSVTLSGSALVVNEYFTS